VISMFAMFAENNIFNQEDIQYWDTTSVTNMRYIFNNSLMHGVLNNSQEAAEIHGPSSWFNQQFQLVYYASNGVTLKVNATSLDDFKALNNNSAEITFNGVLYTVVDDTTLHNEIANQNYNLITTFVTNMDEVFKSETSFNVDISYWDTSNVTTMDSMFRGASSFNQPIGNWDTSNVENIAKVFMECTAFNQDIGEWDTSNVTNMNNMFREASSFNQDISGWDTSKVNNMETMFQSATAFNHDISNWDTSIVTSMQYMFMSASSFNQKNIQYWDTNSVGAFNFDYVFYGSPMVGIENDSGVTATDHGPSSWFNQTRP